MPTIDNNVKNYKNVKNVKNSRSSFHQKEPFESEPDESPEDTTVQDAFLDCQKYLGMSQEEVIDIFQTCPERGRFAEAVRFAIEKNEDQLLENPSGFIKWAYDNGKTSKRTRGACRNASKTLADDPDDYFLEMLRKEEKIANQRVY